MKMNQNEVIDEMMEELAKQQEDYVIDFLKSHGYRPKRTYEYIVGLQERLAKKGLEFVVERTAEEPKESVEESGEYKVTNTLGIKCYFRPLEDKCFSCKHYIFKVMMNGFHGICDNKNSGIIFTRLDNYCEDFEKGRNEIYESERS